MKKLLCLFCAVACSLSLLACDANTAPSQENGAKTLRVGMECNYAPFNWSTNQASEHTVAINEVDFCDGYDVAVAKKIAQGLNKELKIVKMDWDGLIPALNNHDIDLILAGMTDTPERREAVQFTSPYYASQMVVLVKKGSGLENISDIQELKGKKVLGQMATLYDEIIDQIEGVIHVSPQDAYPRMVLSLQKGEVDAVTAELPVAQSVLKNNPDLSIVTFAEGKGFVADTSVSIALRKNDTALHQEVQALLDALSQEERTEMMQQALQRQEQGQP